MPLSGVRQSSVACAPLVSCRGLGRQDSHHGLCRCCAHVLMKKLCAHANSTQAQAVSEVNNLALLTLSQSTHLVILTWALKCIPSH